MCKWWLGNQYFTDSKIQIIVDKDPQWAKPQSHLGIGQEQTKAFSLFHQR